MLLGLVALATLAAALLHGPALGGLGLVGAYVTPLLVGSQEPNYWALYIYLAVVTAAAFALARMRLWRWLAITARWHRSSGCSSAWAIQATVAVGARLLRRGRLRARGRLSSPDCSTARLPSPAASIRCRAACSPAICFGAFMLMLATAHAPLAMATLFALVAATRRDRVAQRSRAARRAGRGHLRRAGDRALGGELVVRAHWSRAGHGPTSFDVKLTGIALHATFAAATAALFGGAGYLAQGRSEQPAFSILWATVAVATPVILLIALYYRITQFDRSFAFAGLALLLAAPARSRPSNSGSASRGRARPRPARSSRPARSRRSRSRSPSRWRKAGSRSRSP